MEEEAPLGVGALLDRDVVTLPAFARSMPVVADDTRLERAQRDRLDSKDVDLSQDGHMHERNAIHVLTFTNLTQLSPIDSKPD